MFPVLRLEVVANQRERMSVKGHNHLMTVQEAGGLKKAQPPRRPTLMSVWRAKRTRQRKDILFECVSLDDAVR